MVDLLWWGLETVAVTVDFGCLWSSSSQAGLHFFCLGNRSMGPGSLPEIIVCEHSSLHHPQMQVKAHLKWTEAKWENCSAVRWFEIWKEFHFKKPSSLIVCGYISTYRSVSLHIWNSNSNIQFLEHMLPSCWCFFSFQGRPFTFQQENTKPHTAAINTARLWGRVQALNWLVCSPDLSPA